MAVKLIIAGLRRSGTTIFWETVRQDRRLRCYDEPFNPNLSVLPGTTGLKAPEEFVDLLEQDPDRFWESYTPIHFSDELRHGLSDRHRDWFRFLAESGEAVMMDVTRCTFKLEALAELAPDAVLVHLYRPAAGLATSHLLPSAAGRRGKVRQRMHRAGFWTRTDRYNGWSFESILSEPRGSLFGKRLREIGLDPETVHGLPAVGKLLAYWKVCFEQVESVGPRCFGGRFVSQSFDAFCRDPGEAMARVYAALDMPLPDVDYGRIRPAAKPHDADSPQWDRFAGLLGLPSRCGAG